MSNNLFCCTSNRTLAINYRMDHQGQKEPTKIKKQNKIFIYLLLLLTPPPQAFVIEP